MTGSSETESIPHFLYNIRDLFELGKLETDERKRNSLINDANRSIDALNAVREGFTHDQLRELLDNPGLLPPP